MTTKREDFLREAIRLAASAREKGNHPFGALLVLNGEIVLTAENSVTAARDSTCHAELNLVRRACQRYAAAELRKATLYSSAEPCVMCAGAMYWAGIRRVVYALSARELGKLTGGSLVVPCREVFDRAKDLVEVAGPYLIAEARKVHLGFWNSGRNNDPA